MSHLVIGASLFALGVLLIFVGLPKKGVHPRFLRFPAALVLYPPVILVSLALGAAELVSSLLSVSQ